MLKGKAKVDYQRDYMRKRRATVRSMKEVRPDLKSLDLLDQTLVNCRSGLVTVNNNLEEMKNTLTGNSEKLETIVSSEILTADDIDKAMKQKMEADVHKMIETEDKAIMGGSIEPGTLPREEEGTKATVCPACGGLGYQEFEHGLIRLPCKECKK